MQEKNLENFIEPYVLATSSDEKLRLLNSHLVPGGPEWFFASILHELNSAKDDPARSSDHLQKANALVQDFKKLDDSERLLPSLYSRYLLLRAEVDGNWGETLDHFQKHYGLEKLDHQPPPDVDLGVRSTATQDSAAHAVAPSVLDATSLQTNALLEEQLKGYEDNNLSGNATPLTPSGIVLAASALVNGNGTSRWNIARAIDHILENVNHPAALTTAEGTDLLPAVLARKWAILQDKPHVVVAFNKLQCYDILTAHQLEQLEALCPGIRSDQTYISARVRAMSPGKPEDLKAESPELEAIRQYVESTVSVMPRDFVKVKARLILTIMRKLQKEKNRYDESLLLEYLKIPIQQHHRIYSTRDSIVMYGNFSDILPNPYFPAGDDHQFIENYLDQIFRSDSIQDWEKFKPYFEESYIRRVFLEAKITSSSDVTKWTQSFPSADLQRLSEKVVLEIPSESNPETVDPNSSTPVRISLRLKNVPSLVVQVFEVNTFAYHRDHEHTVSALQALDVSGLVPNREERFEFTEHALKLFETDFELVEASKSRGIWIVEFLGGGLRTRAVIRKGYLKFLERVTADGHMLTVVDESNARVPGRIWMSGHFFEPDEDGDILIPFTSGSTSIETLLLINGTFTHRHSGFQHLAETYTLTATFHGLPESISRGNKCDIVVRAALQCNDVQVPLSLLKDVKLTVETNDLDDVHNVKVVENFVISDDRDGVYSFVVPENLQSVKFKVEAKVKVESKHTEMELEAESGEVRVNLISKSKEISALFLQRCGEGYRVALLGKNGEPRAEQDVVLELQHRLFQDSFKRGLRTDERGFVQLGQLSDITKITATSGNVTASWDISVPLTLPEELTIAEGTPVRIPYAGDLKKLRKNEWCLLRKGGEYNSINVADISDQASFEVDSDPASNGSGVITLPSLLHGIYEFQVLDHQSRLEKFTITVVKREPTSSESLGDWRHHVVLSKTAAHQISPLQDSTWPLRVVSASFIETQRNRLKIHIDGAIPKTTRVHVFVSTFLQGEEDAPGVSQEPRRAVSLSEREFTQPENQYSRSEELAEELLYVLNRARAAHSLGSSLEKPGVILNRYKIGNTELQTRSLDAPMPKPAILQQQQQMPGGVRARGFFGTSSTVRDEAYIKSRESRWNTAHFMCSYDFLSSGGFVLTNLVPDEEGTVLVDVPESVDPRVVTVLAADYRSSVMRRFALPHQETKDKAAVASRDLRLTPAWPMDAHVVESNTIAALKPGESVSVEGRYPAVVSTAQKLFDVAEALAPSGSKDAFGEFRFLSRWSGMNSAEKLKLYDKYACHELNLLLHAKDKEFLETVIQPYLRNKVEKTVVDWYILGDVEALREQVEEPWRAEKLSDFERCMAARAVGGDVLVRMRAWAFDRVRAMEVGSSSAQRAKQRDLLFRTVTAGADEAGQGEAARREDRDRDRDRSERYKAEGGSSASDSEDEFDFDEEVVEELEESDDDMGFGLFSDEGGPPPAPESSISLFGAGPPPAPMRAMAAAPPPPPPAGFGGFGAPITAVLERGERLESLEERTNALSAQAFAFKAGAKKKMKKAMTFYEAPESTSAWAERQYWSGSTAYVNLNAFWREWIDHESGVFISENFGEALTSGFTEAMLAMAVIDLPLTDLTQAVDVNGTGTTGLNFTARNPVIMFYREMKTVEAKPLPSIILSQEYLDPQNRQAHDVETNEYYDRYIDIGKTAFLPGKVYGCRVSVTNTSSVQHLLSPLLQIPAGALPVEGFAIKTHRLVLKPFETQLLEYKFYFPAEGEFEHYPVQVSKSGWVVAHASKSTLRVAWPQPDAAVPEETMRTWEWVASRHATVEQLVGWLKAPSSRLPGGFDMCLWRCKSKESWRSIVDALRGRGVFDAGVWGYALKHGERREAVEWLNLEMNVVDVAGEAPFFSGAGVVWDVFERGNECLKEHWPLINARTHQLGKRPRVNDADFLKVYNNFLLYLAHKPSTLQTSADHITLACQLILQDRIEEAQSRLQYLLSETKAGRLQVQYNLQLDYALAWLDLVDADGELREARRVASEHAECPILRWKNMFREVRNLISELDRAAGEGETAMDVDEEEGELSTREARAARRGNGEPRLDVEVERGKLRLSHANVSSCEVLFHPVNLETEFSARPFELASAASSAARGDGSSAGGGGGGGAEEKSPALYVLSKHRTVVDLPVGGGDLVLEVPGNFRGGTCLVEVAANGGDIVKSKVWARSDLAVDVQHRNGLVKVLIARERDGADKGPIKESTPGEEDEWSLVPAGPSTSTVDVSTSKTTVWKPLPRCYVKVYARVRGEGVVFYKDGYTDRLGRFDYASLSNTELLGKAEKFAVLCVGPGEGDGGVAVEAAVPKV
ncbi:hypothetical protein HDV00_011944 [Rhizophlyctis rosea]|nr:hypothetical protein HDV00_011944 [Rhizophlyctis rosea]